MEKEKEKEKSGEAACLISKNDYRLMTNYHMYKVSKAKQDQEWADLGYVFLGWYREVYNAFTAEDFIKDNFDYTRLYVLRHKISGHIVLFCDEGNSHCHFVGTWTDVGNFYYWED